ncbi:MAG: hypothetical protein HXY40_04415 [Chloroflexi bacterium]|nr:hypothetical protein [Chloroflexota bacterium]
MDKNLLPPPFAWCPVTAGTVMLDGLSTTYAVGAFDIGRYPLTNAQLARR